MPVGPQGGGVRLKASEAETGGWCSVWEGRVEAGMVGAGLHFHRARDEFFFVLEGELELRLGEESQVVRAGTFAFVPRGTVHGFRNPGDLQNDRAFKRRARADPDVVLARRTEAGHLDRHHV